MSTATIAIISLVISGIALFGVGISLVLQARQLRASQMQASRSVQAETVRMGFDKPGLIAGVLGESDPELLAKNTYVNWIVQHLKMNYILKVDPPIAVRNQLALLFGAELPRQWWIKVRTDYWAEAASKRAREFVAMIDEVIREAKESQEAADSPPLDASPSSSGGTDQRDHGVLPP